MDTLTGSPVDLRQCTITEPNNDVLGAFRCDIISCDANHNIVGIKLNQYIL